MIKILSKGGYENVVSFLITSTKLDYFSHSLPALNSTDKSLSISVSKHTHSHVYIYIYIYIYIYVCVCVSSVYT